MINCVKCCGVFKPSNGAKKIIDIGSVVLKRKTKRNGDVFNEDSVPPQHNDNNDADQ